MEHRNNDELILAQAAHADETLRALLLRHGEPQDVPPPPLLIRHILAQLPNLPPAQAAVQQQRRRRWRVATTVCFASVLVLLTALGAWGAFVNSSGPATLFGGADTSLGHIVLVLTLSAKPLLRLMAALGTPTLVSSTLLIAFTVWAWWRLAQQPLTPAFAEVDL